MNVLSNIKDHTCLIVPSSLKKKILLELSKITSYPYQIKFMDFNSLKKHLFFDYDLSAISYLMDKYHLKAEVCKVYLDNMYYIEDKNYQSNKLQSLLQLKKDLEANNLLQKDIFFSYFLDSQEVIIAGYPPLDCFQKRMVELLSKVTNVTVLEQEEQEDKVLDVYAFDTMEEEIDFVSCSILDLLEKGISLNNIKLANVTEEYYNTIKRVFSYYHLPIMLEESSIYSTAYSKVFLTTFKETESLEESFNSVKEKYPNEIELEKQLLLICNQVTVLDCSFESKLEILEYLLKNTKQQQPKLNQAIETVSFTCCEPNDDDYVFLLGINQNVFPKLYQDEDYISDNLKKEVCLPLTKEKNQLSRFWAQEMIKKIPHLIMSYKLKSPFEAYYPSSMLAELDVNIIKKPTYNKYRYSNLSNEIKLTKKLDRYRKFHEEDEDLALLQQNYSNLPYLTYQNKFTGIDKQRYLNYINHKLLLSYTSMNQYYQCAFRYYLNYVLKLNPFEDTFQAFIGNLYHKLLSLAFLSNFDFEKEFTNYLKTRDLTVSETFFLQKLKRELKQTIDIIKEQQELTNFRQELYEKEIIIPLQNEIKVLFKGTIDKIMYQEKNGNTYVSLIDYKTGFSKSDLFQMPYGLNMQLPVYLYLVKNSNFFSDIKFTGFYLQKILHNEVTKKIDMSIKDQKKQEMKLVGYSIDDEYFLEQFDITYQDSELIKSMKMTSKGFSRYAKIVTEEEIDEIISLTETKIKEAVLDIIEAKFDINPKKIGKENVSCAFCPFADICYHREEDIVLLQEETDLSFLTSGGEDNG